jgi:hypothetical protein
MSMASPDSLDIIERVMAIEEAFSERMITLSPDGREELIREILARLDCDEFGNNDDALAILVRRLGPQGPMGKSGIAVLPELESEGIQEEELPGLHAPRIPGGFEDNTGV